MHMIQHNKFANDCNHMYRAWLTKHWLFTLNKKKFGSAEKSAVKCASRNSAEKNTDSWKLSCIFLKLAKFCQKNSAEGSRQNSAMHSRTATLDTARGRAVSCTVHLLQGNDIRYMELQSAKSNVFWYYLTLKWQPNSLYRRVRQEK